MSGVPYKKHGYLARALASGQSISEAAASFDVPVEGLGSLMSDPFFLELIDGWRGYLAAESESEQIRQLTVISWVILRSEAARGNPRVIAYLESQDFEPEHGTLH